MPSAIGVDTLGFLASRKSRSGICGAIREARQRHGSSVVALHNGTKTRGAPKRKTQQSSTTSSGGGPEHLDLTADYALLLLKMQTGLRLAKITGLRDHDLTETG